MHHFLLAPSASVFAGGVGSEPGQLWDLESPALPTQAHLVHLYRRGWGLAAREQVHQRRAWGEHESEHGASIQSSVPCSKADVQQPPQERGDGQDALDASPH